MEKRQIVVMEIDQLKRHMQKALLLTEIRNRNGNLLKKTGTPFSSLPEQLVSPLKNEKKVTITHRSGRTFNGYLRIEGDTYYLLLDNNEVQTMKANEIEEIKSE